MIWHILTGILAVFYLSIVLTYRHVHMMQQNTYRIGRYFEWYISRFVKETRFSEALLLLPFVLAFFSQAAFGISAGFIFLLLTYLGRPRPQKEKKPLVFTNRAKRLYSTTVVLLVLIVVLLLIFIDNAALLMGLLIVVCFCSRFAMLLATIILMPVERMINNSYLHDAKRKISRLPDLQKIGITGSFGKTSTKVIMAAVLSEKYQTLASPQSYNTPMGLTRTIREQLSAVDEVFVAEMGAKQKGDIAELCQLVQPTIGVLTAIGEQHLESFGSIETIIDTKFELIDSLPKNGFAVVNGDDSRIISNISRAKCPVITYGLSADCDYRAEQISYGQNGVSFTLCHGEQRVEFMSVLLGRHMISNILAALAVADQLGLSIEQMQRGVKMLPAIEHRLQLRKSGGFYIIDDAFNSNPAGAAAALEVLAAFADSKKIIITPGMVELGERQYQLNYELAQQMAAVADYIILVGKKHSEPLQKGIADVGYPKEQLYVAADLNEARRIMAKVVESNSVVLFENDLPDSYNE